MLSGLTSSPTIQATISTAQPTSPPRIGRLRGLSYLRHYNTRSDQSDSLEARSWTRRIASAATVTSHESYPAVVPSVIEASSPPDLQSDISTSRRLDGASRASTGGWLPSVDGSSGPPRPTTQLQPSPITTRRTRRTSNYSDADSSPTNMTRQRAVTTPNQLFSHTSAVDVSTLRGPGTRRTSNGVTASPPTAGPSQPHLPVAQLPSIRLVPYQDPRTPRPSLNFQTTTRTLPNSNSVVRVGRYSEKDSAPHSGSNESISDAPIGFKSKVVSRRHCEFFYERNQWYIKDVKSSSGTFLNHVRLSGPGQESKPFAVKDGDLVQLGIDFKGGEETIFRCVKIRILCNQGWQKSVNKFSKSAHKHLNDLQRSTSKGNEAALQASTECTICLNPVAPCQSLFVAPCSHTWHYKCIRPMLGDASRNANHDSIEIFFTCPNCRNVADLEADVDDIPMWDESNAGSDEEDVAKGLDETHVDDEPLSSIRDVLAADMSRMSMRNETTPRRSSSSKALNPSASDFVPGSSPSPISPGSTQRPRLQVDSETASHEQGRSCPSTPGGDGGRDIPLNANNRASNTLALTSLSVDLDINGPMTPRNTVGPFVFDGGAGREDERPFPFLPVRAVSSGSFMSPHGSLQRLPSSHEETSAADH